MSHLQSKTILIIQTAFIGDTILASHFARAVKDQYPNSKIHFFLRKGNESVIEGLPTIEKTWVWSKENGKTKIQESNVDVSSKEWRKDTKLWFKTSKKDHRSFTVANSRA